MSNLKILMYFRAKTSKLVTVAVVLVAALFFFHGSDGGFQATNGPTSTLKECAVRLLLQWLILLLAQSIIGVSGCAKRFLLTVLDLLAPSLPLRGSVALAPLRC